MANANSMVLFLPLESMSLGGHPSFRNCSLRIALDFGIGPSELPVILFFTLNKENSNVRQSAYLRFETEAFIGEQPPAESLLADLFTAVKDARSHHDNQDIIVALEKKINIIKRENTLRPIKKWAVEYIINIANLPLDIVKSMGIAYGKRIVG